MDEKNLNNMNQELRKLRKKIEKTECLFDTEMNEIKREKLFDKLVDLVYEFNQKSKTVKIG